MTGTGPGSFPGDDERPDRDWPLGGEPRDGEPLDGHAMDDAAFDEGALDDDLDAEDADEEITATFRPIPGGATCYFGPAQAGVIRSLVGQVAELISTEMSAGAETAAGPGDLDSAAPEELERMLGLSGNAELPEDPVLARLLPDAYSGDPKASAEFRRYTEESLRAGKINSAQAVLASLPAGGGDVVLSEPECQQWLKALNDVRLALGVRLGISDEDEDFIEGLSAGDPRLAYIPVYQWLAYLQDSLIESLS